MAVSSGCYLLAVIGEPVSEDHKQIILQRLNKGLLSWDINATGCDLSGIENVCANATDKTALENDLLIQYSTESLGVEVLVNPSVSTLKQCVKNLLTSTIGHKHIIHAGYTFAGSGSWIMQNGAYSFEDFLSAFKDAQVQSQKGCTIHVHCIEEGDWNSRNFDQEVFTKVANVLLNPMDKLDQLPGANYMIDCLQTVLSTQSLTEIMEASPLVGNIRFNRPTLYLFPAGQGDCALFGINGFNMLVDGGFNRKPCSWEFIRHLDRLDAVLVTRLSESNLCSMSTLMKRKTLNNTYPQIGYVFCNIAEGKNPSPTEEMQKDKNELLVSVVGEGHQFINTLNDLKLVPHQCWCDSSTEPFVLYHKVGHGTLEMHVLSPPKDSKEMRDFLSEWSSYKENFSCVKTGLKGKGQGALIPLSHATSVCAILIWRPNDPKDTITRILFPGSAPQNKIFEGLEKLKNLDILKQPIVTKASLSTVLISKAKKTNGPLSKASIPNRKHTASPALSVSSMASRNGDIIGLKKEIKTDKVSKEVKRVIKDIKKETKAVKEIKKDNKEKEIKKDNKEKEAKKDKEKEVKKEVKDIKASAEKKLTAKSTVKKTTSAPKSTTDTKKSTTVKKDTPASKKEAAKPPSATKLKSLPTKTIEAKTAKEVMNKKAAETKTVSKPKSKPTAASVKASPPTKTKMTPVPKSPSKLSRAIAASAAIITAAVTVDVAAELLEPKNEEEIEKEEELKIEIEEELKIEIEEELKIEIEEELKIEIEEELKIEIEENEIKENIVEEEANVVKDTLAQEEEEEEEINIDQNEIPVSPLRQEAASPALSEPVSLTASDTLSSAPIETVSPTPPQEIISPIEEKDVNEIKELDMSTPTVEEKLLDQDLNEIPVNLAYESEDLRETSVDEGIAETDVAEDNLEVHEVDKDVCEEPEEPVEELIVKKESNTNLMTASFVAESLEQAEEEFLSRQSAVQQEMEQCLAGIPKISTNEPEDAYEENVANQEYDESGNKRSEETMDIDSQLASATMEGSFCADMANAMNEEDAKEDAAIEEKDDKEQYSQQECTTNIMETSIVFTESDLQANETGSVDSYEMKGENYEVSENMAIENLDIPDYHQELNPSLEVNIHDTHSEISTQESDIKSEEIQQISTTDDIRSQHEVNIEDVHVEPTMESVLSDEGTHIEQDHSGMAKQELLGMEMNMAESFHQDAIEEDKFSDRQSDAEDNFPTEELIVEGNLHNLDTEHAFSEDILPTTAHNFEKEEISKESFIEKDIDESMTEIEHAPEAFDRSTEKTNDEDQHACSPDTALPENEHTFDGNSLNYGDLHSNEQEYPPEYDIPENMSQNEKYDTEKEIREVDELAGKESPVSFVHSEQDNLEDVRQSEDDVDIQHYMSKDSMDNFNREKSSAASPYKESDSDTGDVVKSPMPQADMEYQSQKFENQDQFDDERMKSNFSEEKQMFDEKDHDSAEDDEEMIRHPSPPGSHEFYQQVGPSKNLEEMRDPITQHYISSPAITGKSEEPLYEEPEDSGSERSQSPLVEQPVFGSIEKVDFPELVNVSGGTTPSEPQSPKSPLDSKKGNLGALEIEVMEALSEHDCSESSSQSPLACDEQGTFDLPEKGTTQIIETEEHASSEIQLECAVESKGENSSVVEESDVKSGTEYGYEHDELLTNALTEQEHNANVESHKHSDVGYDAQDASESDFAYQPESDLHYEQTSELVCKPESEQHCESQSDSQLERNIHQDEILHEDIQEPADNATKECEQNSTNDFGEMASEDNIDVKKTYDDYEFLPPSDFANEDQTADSQLTKNIETIPAQAEIVNVHEEVSHTRDVNLLEKCPNDALESATAEDSYHNQEEESKTAFEEKDSKLLQESFHEDSQLKNCDRDAPESHQNTEQCKDETESEKETNYFEEATVGASKHIEECDESSNKAIPESERHYRNGFGTSDDKTDYSSYAGDVHVPPHGMNGQGNNSWQMYSDEYSGMESSYNRNYNSSYTEINTTKMISGEQQMAYVTDTYYQSDSPEDNSMKNSSSPDVPSPVDPEIVEDPLNPLSLEPPVGYDGINNKYIPVSDDYHPDNINYINTIPPPLKSKNGTNIDRSYGESSEEEEDSSSLPGNVSPYAYTNKAYNQEEEEDADGNHIIKPPLGMDQTTEDGNPISTYDSNNPQAFPENLTFESRHQRVNSGLVYSPGFNQDISTTESQAYDFRLEEWGKPMGLPTPPDATTKTAKKPVKTASSKSAKSADKRSSLENGKMPSTTTKLMSSPLKKVKESASSNSNPVYVDLAYVPHHGDPHYSDIEFFKKIRARYYVFSGISPSKEVLNALLEAKKGWNEDLETTIIPTYETDTLGYWMAQNQEALTEYSIDVAPSASRCTVNLQDHETSCAAYRLEF